VAFLLVPANERPRQPALTAAPAVFYPPVRYERVVEVRQVPVVQREPARPEPAQAVAAREEPAVVQDEEAPPPVAPVAVAAPPVEAKPAAPEKCVACEQGASDKDGSTYGTAIRFNGNPLQAADEAHKDKRLLFVLHISGNFEDDRFT
jgi:hypothetical protein